MPIILRLDRIMVDRKMTLKELAENVGISYVNLSKIKTGKVQGVRFSTLEAICETLDCQPGDILEFVHEDHPDAAGREGGGNDEEDGAEGKESLRDRHRRLKDDLILEAANRRCRHDTRDERSFRKKVMPAPGGRAVLFRGGRSPLRGHSDPWSLDFPWRKRGPFQFQSPSRCITAGTM